MFNKKTKKLNKKLIEVIYENAKYIRKQYEVIKDQAKKIKGLENDNELLNKEKAENQKKLLQAYNDYSNLYKKMTSKDTLYVSIDGKLFGITRFVYDKEAGAIPEITVIGKQVREPKEVKSNE